jgi:hypothetical protein
MLAGEVRARSETRIQTDRMACATNSIEEGDEAMVFGLLDTSRVFSNSTAANEMRRRKTVRRQSF